MLKLHTNKKTGKNNMILITDIGDLKIKHLIKSKLITQAYSVTYFKHTLLMHLLSTLANTAMDLLFHNHIYCSENSCLTVNLAIRERKQ